MKYERIQELFRYITPGLYLLALVLIANFEALCGNDKLRDTIAKFSSIIILLLPFVGFVIGYFIECLMAWIERLLYWFGIPRPSKVVLNGKCSLYVVDNDILKRVNKGSTVKNKDANKYQQIAKQMVGGKEVVLRYYYQSIMARHILGAQLLASIYYFCFKDRWTWTLLGCCVVIIALLIFFWYHQTCVYMKYLMAEYGKFLGQH